MLLWRPTPASCAAGIGTRARRRRQSNRMPRRDRWVVDHAAVGSSLPSVRGGRSGDRGSQPSRTRCRQRPFLPMARQSQRPAASSDVTRTAPPPTESALPHPDSAASRSAALRRRSDSSSDRTAQSSGSVPSDPSGCSMVPQSGPRSPEQQVSDGTSIAAHRLHLTHARRLGPADSRPLSLATTDSDLFAGLQGV